MRDTTSRSILLAEDDEGTIYSVSRCLEIAPTNWNLTIAHNGEEALEYCKKTGEGTHFDILLMDLHMPLMNGLESCSHIRKLPPYTHIPIIAFTANSRDYPWEECQAAGMNDMITKPFDIDELLEIIETHTHTKEE